MSVDPSAQNEVRTARRYFSSFAQEYHRAFAGKGRVSIQGTINRLFRHKTFRQRTEVVRQFLERHGAAGKQVLDLGCGSGEVSLVAARLGAQVTGLDIVDEMVALARRQAADAGLSGVTEFRVQDIIAEPFGPADITMLVGVIEYYRDLEPLLTKAAAATRELLIIVDTRGPFWRRALRRVLARLKRFYLYYRDPDRVAAIVTGAGLVEQARIRGHSFTAMAFRRR